MEETVKKLKKGDNQAFEKLFEEYQQKIYALSFSLLQNREDALDVLQEVFIKIYNKISSFNGESSLSTWIFTITKNTCYDHLRKNKRNPEEEIPENVTDTSPLPEDILQRKEARKAVRAALDTLPPKYKTVLLLREYGDLSYGEIAAVMKMSEGTVKSRISRARDYLLKEILKNGELF